MQMSNSTIYSQETNSEEIKENRENSGRRTKVILSLYGAFFAVVLALFVFTISTKQGSVLAAWDAGVKKAIVGSISTLKDFFSSKQIAENQPAFEPELTWGPTPETTVTPTATPAPKIQPVAPKPRKQPAPVKSSVQVEVKTGSGYSYSSSYQFPKPKPGEPGSPEWEADFQRRWNEMSAQNSQAQKDMEARQKEFDAKWQASQKSHEDFMKEWNALNNQIKGN